MHLTRAALPAARPNDTSLVLIGENTPGDAGCGAIYGHGHAGGLRAIQDACGQWWNLIVPRKRGHAGWFGALGDGADCSGALDLAFLHCDVLTIGPGEFRCGPLAMRDGQIVEGSGWATLLKLTDGESGTVISLPSVNRARLRHLSVDGNSTSAFPPTDGHGVQVSGLSAANVIEDVHVANTMHTGIHGWGLGGQIEDTRVVGCKTENTGQHGISFQFNHYRTDVEGCDIREARLYCGIEGFGSGGTDFRVEGCRVHQYTYNEVICISADGCLRPKFLGNTVAGGQIGLEFANADCGIMTGNTSLHAVSAGVSISRSGPTATGSDTVIVTSNIIRESAGEGIKMTQAGGGHTFVVGGNIIQRCGQRGIHASDFILGSLTGNVVSGCGMSGSMVEATAGPYTTISGNTVIGNNTTHNAQEAGLRIYNPGAPSVTHGLNRVEGNHVADVVVHFPTT